MFEEKPLTATQKAHAWQGHRILCVELAIKAGIDAAGLIRLAGEISNYIMTPCANEKNPDMK